MSARGELVRMYTLPRFAPSFYSILKSWAKVGNILTKTTVLCMTVFQPEHRCRPDAPKLHAHTLDSVSLSTIRMYTFLRFCFLEKLFLGNKISKDELESAEKVKNLSVSRKFGDFCDQLDKEELDFERRIRRISKNVSSQVDF